MSKYIYPLTKEVAVHVASNLRPEDHRECTEGHGHNPLLALLGGASSGYSAAFMMPNGKWGAAGGVGPENGIWMLCTPEINNYPKTFARECKRLIESRPEKMLWNICDKRNEVHLKLLRFLGFKFLREVTHGPNNLTFIEFCRVRTNFDADCGVNSA
jgi:hypothetical protein